MSPTRARGPAVSIFAKLFIATAATLTALACSTSAAPEPITRAAPATPEHRTYITIGDISAEPTEKIERFQPLAEYLAENLSAFGITVGRVVVTPDIEHMAQLVADGEVDLFIDSPFPALSVQAASHTDFILRRWKEGKPSYWSVFVVTVDSGLSTLDDLKGRVVSAEDAFSTTGYALPTLELLERGYTVHPVSSPAARVAEDEIGVWFSGDEENTVEMLLQGRVAGGLLSNLDYAALPDELRSRLSILGRTPELPRQIVSARRDLDARIVARVRSLLIDLERTEAGLELLEHMKTARFDAISSVDADTLENFGLGLRILP